MAALVRHGVFKTALATNRKNVLACCYATKAEKKKGIDRKVGPKIDTSIESLAAKGFLRPQKEYNPPADLESKITSLLHRFLGNFENRTKLDDINKRFTVFNACFKEFQHSIPNSLLHTIETVADIKKFYATPIDVKTPLDRLKMMDLPENLHIQYEYHRYHPSTEKLYGGITAFPRSSTLVTGLKYKDKYPGHEQAQTWPYTS